MFVYELISQFTFCKYIFKASPAIYLGILLKHEDSTLYYNYTVYYNYLE